MSDERPTLRFDGVQLAAGALTAVTSAVLLSTVGVAGTVIGAAVGSVLGTVGNAVYSHYLALSKQRVATARSVAESRARDASVRAARARGQAAVGGDREGEQLHRAEEDLQRARADLDVADRARVSWRDAVSDLPWRRIVAVAGVVFVLGFGAILAFEAIAGRALSTYTGGTDEPARISIPGVDREPREDRPDESPQQPDEPAETGTEPAPTTPPSTSGATSPSVPTTTAPGQTTEPAPTGTGTPAPAEPTP